MRIGLAAWACGLLWTHGPGLPLWLDFLAPILLGLGGLSLSFKLDDIAQAADRD